MKGYIFIFLAFVSIASAADPCEVLADGEFRAHESDCGKFYVCNFSKSVLRSCAFDLHFNPLKKYCQSKASAGCDLTETTTEPPVTTTTPKPTTEPPITTTTPKPTTKPPITTTTPKPTTKPPPTIPPPTHKPGSCKGRPLGTNIPFEGDCNKYITCIGGGVVRECPPLTHFHEDIQVCDWPERANCPWW